MSPTRPEKSTSSKGSRAQGASTDSGMVKGRFGPYNFASIADFGLLRSAADKAEAAGLRYHAGNMLPLDQAGAIEQGHGGIVVEPAHLCRQRHPDADIEPVPADPHHSRLGLPGRGAGRFCPHRAAATPWRCGCRPNHCRASHRKRHARSRHGPDRRRRWCLGRFGRRLQAHRAIGRTPARSRRRHSCRCRRRLRAQ